MLVTEKSVRVEPSCSLEKYRNQSSHLQSNQQYSSISQVLAEQPELVHTKLMSLLVTLVVLPKLLLSNYQSSSRILYSVQKQRNQSVRYRGWIYNFYCTRRSKYQVHSKLERFWYSRSICFYRNKSYQDLHWYWFSQEILWCSRVCHLQPRRETTIVLLLWSENCRESYLQSTRRRSTSRLHWRCIREIYSNNIGTGTVFTSGVSTNSLTKIYIGDGQLFGLGGAAESVTFNPDEKKHSSTLLVLDLSDLQDLILAMVLYSQSTVLQNLLLLYHQQKDYSNSAVLLQKEHPQSRRAVVFYSTSLPASSVVHLHTARQAHLIFLVSLTLQEQLITLDLVICLQLMVLLSLQQIESLLKVTLHSVAMLRLSLLEDSLDLEIYSDSTVQLSLEQSLFLREQSTTLLVLLARDSRELLHLISILRSLVPQLKRFSRGAWITTGQVTTIGDTQHSYSCRIYIRNYKGTQQRCCSCTH